jgi:hypothetical protein
VKGEFREYQQKSVIMDVSSMLVNDNIMPYYGKDFERVHISIFEALDYALLGRGDDAAIEARLLDSFLRILLLILIIKIFIKIMNL